MKHNITPNTRVRRARDRGTADHGWLTARFTFSFADYFDPEHMGFHALRVMNNDTIAPGGGFPTHSHSDMEIFTYVINGELEHKDSMGNGSVIRAGDLQYMSAGSGIHHSEFNPSSENPTNLYQVWLHPNERGSTPRYAEKPLGNATADNALTLLFSRRRSRRRDRHSPGCRNLVRQGRRRPDAPNPCLRTCAPCLDPGHRGRDRCAGRALGCRRRNRNREPARGLRDRCQVRRAPAALPPLLKTRRVSHNAIPFT